MIVFSDINKLQALADGAPKMTNDDILALADLSKAGDESALYQLFYVLLPVFCAEYKLQAGVSAKNSELLQLCLDSYIRSLKGFDFRSGNDLTQHIGKYIREARQNYVSNIRIPIDELKKMLE